MKISILFSLVLIILLTLPAAAQTGTGPSLAGNWFGTLDAGGTKLRLLLKVEKTTGGYAAKLDSIDQDAKDLPLDSVALNGNKVTFAAAALGLTYDGTVNEKYDEIVGTFNQGSASMPLILTRMDAANTTAAPKIVTRPQDPVKPYPYDEEEVNYRNAIDNVKLAGTLTLPRDKSKSYPAVVLITGSGAQDRNETVYGHRPFLVLADYLTRNGIAVLRVDDRGVGGSDIGSPSATSENFALDVLAGVEYLKTRKEVNGKQIGLVGHSEGGVIAPIAATRSKDVAFIVMLAGLGQLGEDVIYTQTELIQRASGADPATIASQREMFKNIHAIVKKETDKKLIEEQVNAAIAKHVAAMNEAQRKSFAPIEATIKSVSPMFTTPWYRYLITYNPIPILKKVKVPVLALNGELDLQVSYKQNLGPIESALKAGGNKDVTVRSVPKLNHLFQTATTGVPTEYATIEETMSPEVLKAVSDWILAHSVGRK